MNKKTDNVEVPVISKNLQAAITGLLELYSHCELLTVTTKGKKVALDRVRAYVRGDRERWVEVANGLKDHVGYAKLSKENKAHASNNLRYLRQIVGVEARPTVKRGTAPETSALDTPSEKNTRVILPELIAKNQNGRVALVLQVLTALDAAFSCTREETIELILSVSETGSVKKNKAA